MRVIKMNKVSFFTNGLFPLALWCLCILTMGGCSSSPSPQASNLSIIFQSSSSLNPDVNGRPSPVDVRIYQLKHLSSFSQSRFFDLYNHSKTLLDKDLLEEHQLEIRPAEERRIDLKLEKDTRYLGFLIAYYDLSRSKWKDVLLVSSLEKDSLFLSLGASGFSIENLFGKKEPQKEERKNV